MFKIAEKTELNQISLTGVRGIVLAGLLIIKPRSLEEIRQAFIELNIMEDENSDDILRIDLNTLKIMGCEISRASQKTDFKYVLGKHPFAFKIEDSEIMLLKKAYNQAKSHADIAGILGYDDLFRKIASRVCDEDKKEALLGISVLKRYDVQMLKDLLLDCAQGRTLSIVYKKPSSNIEETKEVVAQKLVFQNDKVYLYGYDLEKKDSVVLLVSRIKTILSRRLEKTEFEQNSVKVRFVLEASSFSELEEGEVILDNKDGSFVVEGNYHNDFLAVQRILSLGSKCVVTEPVEFKNTIVTKLKEMRKSYGN